MTDVGRRSNSAVTCPHGLLCAWVTGTSVLQSQPASRLISTLSHARSVTKSRLTLCDSMDHSLLGSSVHEILQAGILGWVVIFSSRGAFNPGSLALAGRFSTTEAPGMPILFLTNKQNQLKENLQTRLRSTRVSFRVLPCTPPWFCSQLPQVQALGLRGVTILCLVPLGLPAVPWALVSAPPGSHQLTPPGVLGAQRAQSATLHTLCPLWTLTHGR